MRLFLLILPLLILVSGQEEEETAEETVETTTMSTTTTTEPPGYKVCFRNCALAFVRVRKCGKTCGGWVQLLPLCMIDNKAIAGFREGDWIEFQQYRVTGWSSFGIRYVDRSWNHMTAEIEGDILRGLAHFKMSKECPSA